jgi:hypothetical protein
VTPWFVPNRVRYWLIWAVLWILAFIWFQTSEPLSNFKTTYLYTITILIHFLTGIGVAMFVGVWGSARPNLMNEIQMAEALGWSWAGAKKGFVWGNLGSFFVACLWMVIEALRWKAWVGVDDLSDLFTHGSFPKYPLSVWIVGTMFGVISIGLSSRIVKTKTMPNQGIKLSIRNSLIAGLTFGVLFGMTSALIWTAYGRRPNIGLGIGLLLFSIAVLWYGGIDVLMHFMLRLFLYFESNIPRGYARFLDYASNLIFLQKVGGGYIFIHRLLLEHFATMPLQNETQKKTIQ